MLDDVNNDPEALDILERVRAGGMEELHDALQKASGEWDIYRGVCFSYAALYGAIAALNEGRPENMQAIMANPDIIDLGYGRKAPVDMRSIILDEMLVLRQEDGYALDPATRVESITAAFSNVPADEKTAALTYVLELCIADTFRSPPPDTSCILDLITCGADATHDHSYLLAEAIVTQPEAVIESLYQHGASFDDALTHHMQGRGFGILYKEDDIAKLNLYKECLTMSTVAETAQKPKANRHHI